METSTSKLEVIPSVCECGSALVIASGFDHANCANCSCHWFPTSIEDSQDGIVPQNRETPFQCLRCSVSLEVGKQGNTEVCFCPQCRGFVIDSESLGGLIQSRRAAYCGPDDAPTLVDVNELDIHGRCPACEQTMEAHHYFGPGNIILDTCSTCKLAWLDHGEFAKIIRAPGKR